MKNIKIYALAGLTLIIGFTAAWLLKPSEHSSQDTSVEESSEIWTCSMHPQIRQNEPGLCPICGMDLVPAGSVDGGLTQHAMTREAAALAGIETIIVGKKKGVDMTTNSSLKVNGKIAEDETRAFNLVAHVPGRIEELFINFTGEEIGKGQKIAEIYSPDLITAQKELIEASRLREKNPGLFEAAKKKLKNWKISDARIEDILNSSEVQQTFVVYADRAGIVIEKNVNEGDYVKTGQVLYEIQNLDRLWIEFEVYETDLSSIGTGDEVVFSTPALRGENFTAKITFIDPVIDETTRIAKVRAEVDNQRRLLKPGMFVSGTFEAEVSNEEFIQVPRGAVLWTGERSVVYVKVPGNSIPTFEYREVDLGPSVKNGYRIMSGLTKGDEVVVNGAFVIDASAQLNDKKSMVNEPVLIDKDHHVHSEMDKGKKDSFMVYGNCGMCKRTIESSLKGAEGIYQSEWNKNTKMLFVTYDPDKISLEEINKKITAVGYDTETHKTDDELYEKLPKCCRYDRAP